MCGGDRAQIFVREFAPAMEFAPAVEFSVHTLHLITSMDRSLLRRTEALFRAMIRLRFKIVDRRTGNMAHGL